MSQAELPAPSRCRTAVAGSVVVIGLGYVGRPIAMAAAAAGMAVTGFDLDPLACARANAAWRRGAPTPGRFAATAQATSLPAAEAWVIAVPTPLDRDGAPDLGAVGAALTTCAARLRPGALVTLVSTCQPGATRRLCAPALEAGGLGIGTDIFLAVSPERENPGHAAGPRDTPRLLGALDPASLAVAERFWRRIAAQVIPVASPEIAECAKLLENSYRLVNIALMGELHAAFAALGVPTAEVVRAASTKPFGYQPFWPGLGAGGHCIPVDPAYLQMEARRAGAPSALLDAALGANAARAEAVAARIAAHFGGRLAGRRILVAGVCYKPGVADTRCSAAVRLARLLAASGASVSWHDPLIDDVPAELAGMARSPGLHDPAGETPEALVLGVPHREFGAAALAAAAPVLFDPFGLLAASDGVVTV